MLGASLYTFRKIRIDNCSITSFSLDENGRWVLDAMNDTCHLQ
jgi:broad specificity phosphatase PhoE